MVRIGSSKARISQRRNVRLKEDLEAELVREQIRSMRRPFWRRSEAMLGLLGWAIAFGSFVIQARQSDIEAKQSDVDRRINELQIMSTQHSLSTAKGAIAYAVNYASNDAKNIYDDAMVVLPFMYSDIAQGVVGMDIRKEKYNMLRAACDADAAAGSLVAKGSGVDAVEDSVNQNSLALERYRVEWLIDLGDRLDGVRSSLAYALQTQADLDSAAVMMKISTELRDAGALLNIENLLPVEVSAAQIDERLRYAKVVVEYGTKTEADIRSVMRTLRSDMAHTTK